MTPKGRIVTTKGISIATLEYLESWLNLVRGRDWDDLDAILACALTPDGWQPQFEISRAEVQSDIYLKMLAEYIPRTPWDLVTPLQEYRQGLTVPDTSALRAIKLSLVLMRWMQGLSLAELEEDFAVSAGQVVQAGQRIGWILDAMAQLAETMNVESPERIRLLSEQVRWGLPLPIVRLAGALEGVVSRAGLIRLWRAGITDWKQIQSMSEAELVRLLPEHVIPEIKRVAEQQLRKGVVTPFPKAPGILQKAEGETSPPSELSIRKPVAAKASTPAPTPQRKLPSSKIVPPKPIGRWTYLRPYMHEASMESPPADMPIKPSECRENSPRVRILLKRPGEVYVDGTKLQLPEKQYRLFLLLAQHPGVCVCYEEIYKALWGDIIVEEGQIAFQKCLLVRRLCSVSPAWKHTIRTVPKRGFILELAPEEVQIV
ncbi:MAG: hypothetical protein QXS68_07290 [Candidatus Methanomethylicaceae archaeon]